MKRKSLVISCIITILFFLFTIKVEAKIYSTDVTATSGQEVVIKLTSTVAVSKFKIEVEDAGNLQFKQAEVSTAFTGKISGTTVTGENSNVAGNTFATYTFTAPDVSETKKITVKFKITGMPEQEDTINTAAITVNPNKNGTTPNTNEITENPTTGKESTIKALKSLTVDQGTLTPAFDKEITNYSITVGPEVTQLKVDAIAENAKSAVVVTGNTDFVEGTNNTVKIVVKAEDGTVRTYTIDVTKEEANALRLASLKIEEIPLVPKFNSSMYEYTAEWKEKADITKLNITATANKDDARIEILGNENLKEGDNVITISVKSKDETENATYQLKIKKTIITEAKNEGFTFGTKEIIGASAAGIIVILLFILLFMRHRKKAKEDENFLYSEPIYTKKDEKDEEDFQNFTDIKKGKTIDLSEEEDETEVEDELPKKTEYIEKDNFEDTKKLETIHEEMKINQEKEVLEPGKTILDQGTGRFDRELDMMFHVTDDVEDIEEDKKKKKEKKKGKHF